MARNESTGNAGERKPVNPEMNLQNNYDDLRSVRYGAVRHVSRSARDVDVFSLRSLSFPDTSPARHEPVLVRKSVSAEELNKRKKQSRMRLVNTQ